MERQQQVTVKSIMRQSEEDKLKHLSDQRQSSVSVKEYCEMYDIVG